MNKSEKNPSALIKPTTRQDREIANANKNKTYINNSIKIKKNTAHTQKISSGKKLSKKINYSNEPRDFLDFRGKIAPDKAGQKTERRETEKIVEK